MTNTKTSDLEGVALDWAVAKCEGVEVEYINDGITQCLLQKPSGRYAPSTNWAQSGPIIEREKISIELKPHGYWMASYQYNYADEKRFLTLGDTPLIAAMRCYVASKLGDEVGIPGEIND